MAGGLVPNIRAIRDRATSAFSGGDTRTETSRVRILHEINRQSEEVYRQLEHMASALALRSASLQDASLSVRRQATALVLGTAAVVLALAASGAWLLSRRLLGHVGALLTGTRRIMQGDLGYRVAVARPDEIGQLARSFNAMAQEIQEHRERMAEIVDARTAELKQARDSLLQSEKLASIGLLAAGIAHELNNPLTSILMNVGLLAEDQGLPAAIRAELRRIGEDTMRCRRIIDDLRGYARREELRIAPADLNALAQSALDALGRGSRMQGIDVTREFARAAPLVPCDAARMEQVLANVLDNAIQAMPAGGKLTVGTALHEASAEIWVQDTGSGIPEAVRKRIFDPFFTTKPQGTGLGLSIVDKIMQAHGGKADVTSFATDAPGGDAARPAGTRVVLSLPLEGAGLGDRAAGNERAGTDGTR
jgi:signal transduction histidine kinase